MTTPILTITAHFGKIVTAKSLSKTSLTCNIDSTHVVYSSSDTTLMTVKNPKGNATITLSENNTYTFDLVAHDTTAYTVTGFSFTDADVTTSTISGSPAKSSVTTLNTKESDSVNFKFKFRETSDNGTSPTIYTATCDPQIKVIGGTQTQ